MNEFSFQITGYFYIYFVFYGRAYGHIELNVQYCCCVQNKENVKRTLSHILILEFRSFCKQQWLLIRLHTQSILYMSLELKTAECRDLNFRIS